MQKQLLTSDQATTTLIQHKFPCADCPWGRHSLKGWLGGTSIGQWLQIAHGDGRVECHTFQKPDGGGHECAGAAIYRRNVCKMLREGLSLPVDRENVFARPDEFALHHSNGKLDTAEKVRQEMAQGLSGLMAKD